MKPTAIILSFVLVVPNPVGGQADEELALFGQIARTIEKSRNFSAFSRWRFELPANYLVCGTQLRTLIVIGPRVELPASARRAELLFAKSSGFRAYFSEERPPALEHVCFDLSHTSEGVNYLAIPLIGHLYSVRGDPLLANLVQFFHEAFHVHQMKHFGPTYGSREWPPLVERRVRLSALRRPDFTELAASERSLLAQALQSPNREATTAILARYLTVRRRRMRLLSPVERAAEGHLERKEGLAHWFGLTTAGRLNGLRSSRVLELFVRDLLDCPPIGGADYMSSGYREWHVYATGAAIAALLDKLGALSEEDLAGGGTPIDLLEALFR